MVANLNMNLAERVVIDTNTLKWVASPLPGVERRMLEREFEESGRATSIVRYAPNSHFKPHVHDGGEEFLVLEGVFSDEHGDFGPGSYIRNPIGSKHRPFSTDGCTIYVKLWQMDVEDQTWVKTDTKLTEWHPGIMPGLEVMPLHNFGSENVAMVRWQADCQFARHYHRGGEEVLVVEGTFEDEMGQYPTGTWLRNPPNSEHTPFSSEGCIILVKSGHLQLSVDRA